MPPAPPLPAPRLRLLSLAALLLAPLLAAEVAGLRWGQLPPLPPVAGRPLQPGLASPFVGVHGGALIVAGGANFPDRMPWEGGAKAWWADVFVLERREAGLRWSAGPDLQLPRPLAYGTSVSTPEGVVCVGGSDAERCHADVFLLAWDPVRRELRRSDLPPLPRPLANHAGALVGRTIYVAGGQHVMKGAVASSVFWALDLSRRGSADFRWVELPAWPGPARVLAVAAAQEGPTGPEFFLLSGRVPVPSQPSTVLSDAYAYSPRERVWRTLPPVGGGKGVSVMAGTAAPVGASSILVLGGDRGDLFRVLEDHDLAMESARGRIAKADAAERARLELEIGAHGRAKEAIYRDHPGFGREAWVFETRENRWREVGRSPGSPAVTTLATTWEGSVVIPSGEIRPGVRTPAVVQVWAESR